MSLSLKESLATLGNSNHLDGFLNEYKAAVLSNNEMDKPFTMAPNYYAWLSTASEQVFYRIREMIFVNTGNIEVFDKPYRYLLDHIIDNQNLIKNQVNTIVFFAKIRHLMVHKGFPNPHESPSNNNREIAKGYKFTEEEVFELAKRLYLPKEFNNLVELHAEAMRAISQCENDYEYDYGFLKISKKR